VLSFDIETNFPVLGTKFFCCYGTEQNAFCTLLWNTDKSNKKDDEMYVLVLEHWTVLPDSVSLLF
jgi:hypothetical protein